MTAPDTEPTLPPEQRQGFPFAGALQPERAYDTNTRHPACRHTPTGGLFKHRT